MNKKDNANNRSLTTEQTRFQTEKFTLNMEQLGKWKVSGRDFEGKYRRIRFKAGDLSDAIPIAEELLMNDNIGKTNAASDHDAFPQIRISDALVRAAATRNWTDYTKEKDIQYCTYFLAWIDQQGFQYWDELRFEHIQQYHKSLKDRGLAHDTIRLYLVPVRRTAAWVSANWPKHYSNICQHLRIAKRDTQSSTYDDGVGNPFLSIHQVLDFIEWLKLEKNRKKLVVGVALQGLVGLQMQEALRLTWDKVDFQEGTITIEGFVKNRYRIRRIPVPAIVMELLREEKEGITPSNTVIPHYATFVQYSHALSREIRKWKPGLVLKPKDLRNTLQTTAIEKGWYGYYVQRYVGHAPTTIGERHYHGDKGQRMFLLYKSHILEKLEEEIFSWKQKDKVEHLVDLSPINLDCTTIAR